MIRRIFILFLLIGMCVGGGVAGPSGRVKAKKAGVLGAAVPPVPAVRELSTLLPDSDTVVLIEIQKVLQEFLPRLFAGRQAKLDEINAQIDTLKQKTGIDARVFKQIAIGLQYVPGQQKQTTVRSVVLARGDFKSSALMAAARIAANGKVREVKYKGKSITVISLNELKDQAAAAAGTATKQDRAAKIISGIINDQAGELALFAVDENTLAFGDLARVQETVDAVKTPATNAAIISLAQRVPDSIISIGGKMPPDLDQQLGLDNDAITKALKGIRQAFGAVSFNADSYNLLMGARTTTPAAAVDLRDTLEGLQAIGGMFSGQIKNESMRKVAQRGLDNLKVSQTSNEVQLQLAVPQADAAALVDLWK